MVGNGNKFAAVVFVGIGVFLVIYSWPPSRAALHEEQATVIRVVPHPASRYNVELVTPQGTRLSCYENALRDWPPDSLNRCPIEKFYPLVGKTVTVLHDGQYIYEVWSDNTWVLSYLTFRRVQLLMGLLALMMVAMGIATWRKGAPHETTPARRL
ncbi:hypothetical protein D6833_05795 [Candidatus Parcubacteria bacterium]|nr:MAG: hypothetical protein D6833_05795 [Candidatus Parcubacteria bacterium]